MTEHVPVEQSATACAREQTSPHDAQLVSVRSAVSQPLAGLPSQSEKPGEHAAIRQVPVEQSPVALAGAQAIPQPPQLVSVRVDVSQPFPLAPSQLP